MIVKKHVIETISVLNDISSNWEKYAVGIVTPENVDFLKKDTLILPHKLTKSEMQYALTHCRDTFRKKCTNFRLVLEVLPKIGKYPPCAGHKSNFLSIWK